eukprot:252263-Pelagomonas_calceolata.AAC.1
MDIMLTGEGQSRADQLNSLAEGPPVQICDTSELSSRLSIGFYTFLAHFQGLQGLQGKKGLSQDV